MNPKTSFTVGLAIAALAVGVQTASAEVPDAFERAVASKQQSMQAGSSVFPDVVERAVAAHQRNQRTELRSDSAESAMVFDGRLEQTLTPGPRYSDSVDGAIFAAGPDATPSDDSLVRGSSGRELEWPQIGIGFGVGILLMLGLYLTLRLTRIRPLAH